MATPLILKRGDPLRRRDDDYDVLENGEVVGRIFHLDAAAPEWASGHGRHMKRAAHSWLCRDTRGCDGGVRQELARDLKNNPPAAFPAASPGPRPPGPMSALCGC